MEISVWVQISIICLLGAMSPGPSLALIVNNTVSGGPTYGAVTASGHALGIAIWALLTTMGVSQILQSNPTIDTGSSLLGVLLLIYVGYRTARSGNAILVASKQVPKMNAALLFRGGGEGLILSACNPKVVLFFLAIFSNLLPTGSIWPNAFLISLTAGVIDVCWYVLVVAILGHVSKKLFVSANSVVMRKICGTLLIGSAFYLLYVTVIT